MSDRPPIHVRALATRRDCEACVALQRDVWGVDFADVVPATILMVSQRVGGVAVGAFDASERLVGFVFGLTGLEQGVPVHWSDMLAVRPELRQQGIGLQLKLDQRRRLLEQGVELAYWTYDPLVARNANLNLNRLGATPTEYVIDMYGDTGSALHQGLATDRLIVTWRLSDARVAAAVAGRPPTPPVTAGTPLVSVDAVHGDAETDLPDAPVVRLAIPNCIDTVKARSPDEARRWQAHLRRAFPRYLHAGYAVAGFVRGEDLAWYVLTSST